MILSSVEKVAAESYTAAEPKHFPHVARGTAGIFI
jgi:hypothetical protein